MRFDQQYFDQAEKIIIDTINAYKPELMANFGLVKAEFKADKSVVTSLDKTLEEKLKAALSKFDGSVGFLGEEFGREGSTDNYWLIDPIDGTESFIRGLPSCRNILTFISNDQVEYAFANRFVSDDLFTAIRGQGAKKNGQPVRVNEQPLERAWIEFSVKMLDPAGYEMYQKLKPRIASITVHQDFLRILDGSIEGIIVYKSGGEIWDYAPRAFLISEAGGRVANIGQTTYDIHNFNMIATNAVIFDEIVALLSQ
jgi:myo-inositol-1(or 4)-monophosphatase